MRCMAGGTEPKSGEVGGLSRPMSCGSHRSRSSAVFKSAASRHRPAHDHARIRFQTFSNTLIQARIYRLNRRKSLRDCYSHFSVRIKCQLFKYLCCRTCLGSSHVDTNAANRWVFVLGQLSTLHLIRGKVWQGEDRSPVMLERGIIGAHPIHSHLHNEGTFFRFRCRAP